MSWLAFGVFVAGALSIAGSAAAYPAVGGLYLAALGGGFVGMSLVWGDE